MAAEQKNNDTLEVPNISISSDLDEFLIIEEAKKKLKNKKIQLRSRKVREFEDENEGSEDDTFDSLTRITTELAAILAGAAVGATGIESTSLPIAVVVFASAASTLMNVLTSSFWQDKPGLLASIKDLTKKNKDRKQHKRQMQASLHAANEMAKNLSFSVNTKSLIEMQEFLLFLPDLASYTSEANVFVSDTQGNLISNFPLDEFSLENPPEGLQTKITNLVNAEVTKSQTKTETALTPPEPASSTAFKQDSTPNPASSSKTQDITQTFEQAPEQNRTKGL